MRILLADDEPEITRALKTMLERMQYTVDVAADGREALEFLEHVLYDAVVLDIMMPGLDGLSVLRHMRASGNSTPTGLRGWTPAPTIICRSRFPARNF